MSMEQSTEKIVEAMLPYFPEDSKKSRYLSYRVCGFGVKEAASLTKVGQSTVRSWRCADPKFRELDLSGINELKKKLSSEFINLEFTRNFHLVMQKDLNILLKSVNQPDQLTENETKYLLKLRQFYTPQQYAVIQQLIGEVKNEGFNFTDLVFRISREKEEIVVSKGLPRHALPDGNNGDCDTDNG